MVGLWAEPSAPVFNPPASAVDGLTSEEFPERIRAEEVLAEWVALEGDPALDWVVETLRETDDPEVSQRLLRVLEVAVMARLDAERPGFIGITMNSDTLEQGDLTRAVVLVESVSQGSPASRAELRPGDAIVAIDGEYWDADNTPEQLARKVGGKKPGQAVRLDVSRGTKTLEIDLTLAARPWAAGNWGELQRIDPFAFRMGVEAVEEAAREEAFQRWLAERLSDEAE